MKNFKENNVHIKYVDLFWRKVNNVVKKVVAKSMSELNK